MKIVIQFIDRMIFVSVHDHTLDATIRSDGMLRKRGKLDLVWVFYKNDVNKSNRIFLTK